MVGKAPSKETPNKSLQFDPPALRAVEHFPSFNSMSVLLGNLGGVFTQHDLGVDLDGDGTNDTITINNLVAAGSVFTGDAPGWNYSIIGVPPDEPIKRAAYLAWRVGLEPLNSVINANPSVALSFGIDEWTMRQDPIIPAVPEPPDLTLVLCLVAVALSSSRCRQSSMCGRNWPRLMLKALEDASVLLAGQVACGCRSSGSGSCAASLAAGWP